MQGYPNSTSKVPGERPFYKYTATLEILGIVPGFVFLLLVTSYGAMNFPVYDTAWLAIVDAYLLYEIAIRLRLKYKAVEFYEDRMVVRKWNAVQEFEYADVETARLDGSDLFGRKISIHLRTQSNSLTILKNPKNPASKLDLYSWLLSRTTQARGQN